MNNQSGRHVFGIFAMPFVLFVLAVPVRAAEITLQNDSLVEGQSGNIQAGFVAGESAAAWLTSPCDGNIVGVQIFWRSVDGTAGISFEDSITIFEAGVFPAPGAVMETIVAPVMTDGFVNEFRFLDDNETIPLIVPVTNGQGFVVSFKFANSPNTLFGPSVVTDLDGCQAGKNSINAVPGGWLNSCLLGVTGDFFIRAVVDCGALPGACCEIGGGCSSITGTACSSAGGAFQGEGTDCGSVTCSEACCFQPTGCVDLTVADCDVASGFHQGPGTVCATTTCFPTGACCNPDGTCDDDVLDSNCVNVGGVFQGDGVVCSGVTCPQPSGACCLGNGGCLDLTMSDCNIIPGSAWAGTLTDCTDSNGSGTADDCEGLQAPGLPADPMHQVRKHRYLSINPNTNPSSPTAIKVEVAEMRRCTGDPRRSCLVTGDCKDACDNDLNKACTSDTQCDGGSCISIGTCVDMAPSNPPLAWTVTQPFQEHGACLPACGDTDWIARLTPLANPPYSENWTGYLQGGAPGTGLIHIGDCPIIPCTAYNVYACDPLDLNLCSPPLEIDTQVVPWETPRNYGDVAGPTDVALNITPPDGFTSAVDIATWLLTKKNYGSAALPQAHPTRMDLHGLGGGIPPDYFLTVSDLSAVYIFGFKRSLPWENSQGGLEPGNCP